MEKEQYYKKKSGITLVALVVTVIILLILAGITIMTLTGNNGLINQAIDAKESSDYSQIREEVMQTWYNLQNEVRKRTITNQELTTLLGRKLRIAKQQRRTKP